MADEKRDWQVTRLCCTSGQCVDCLKTHSGRTRRRVVHAEKVTEDYAKQCEKGWKAYDAKASRMAGA